MKLVILPCLFATSAAKMAEDSAYRSSSRVLSHSVDAHSRRLGAPPQRGFQRVTDSSRNEHNAGGLRRSLNSKAGKGHSATHADKVEKQTDDHKKMKQLKEETKKDVTPKAPKEPKEPKHPFSEAEEFVEAIREHFNMEPGLGRGDEVETDNTVDEVDDDGRSSSIPTYMPTVALEKIVEPLTGSTTNSVGTTSSTEAIGSSSSSSTLATLSFSSTSSTDSSATILSIMSSSSSTTVSSTMSSTSSTSAAISSISSTFSTTPGYDSQCPQSCDKEICQCISNEVSLECIPLLDNECKAVSSCLGEFFSGESAVSVFCSSVACLASGKSEAECRCDFVQELCDLDHSLKFQCYQANCCLDAEDDDEREICFTSAMTAPTFWESTTAATTATSTEEVVTTTVASDPTEAPIATTASVLSTVISTLSSDEQPSSTAAATGFKEEEPSAEVLPCSVEFCDFSLSDEFLMRYKVNSSEGSMSVELIYDGVAWLGLALSNDGGMIGSESVIGIPGGVAPQKYYLGGKDTSAVVPMEDERQTLLNSTIELMNDQTVMKFTKLMKEPGEIEIASTGDNFILWAHGFDSNLGYHQSRDQFVLSL
mmetsp:Transcript_26814/g.53846  ORF Transcript_26814/g.53846 Transcript_26814/m.53846 type:complete len:595 (-) Transcript_26814:85-1869(-)